MSQEEAGGALEIHAHASIDIEGPDNKDHGKDRRKMHDAGKKTPRLEDLHKGFDPSNARRRRECCIFRVPEKLQKSYKEDCTPRVIAIGPYHSSNPRLKRMENDKLLYLHHFLQQNTMVPLPECIDRIADTIYAIRSCYDEEIDLSDEQLAEMMVLDGIFIIQLFLIHGGIRRRPDGDQIFDKPWMLNNVRRDMMLLENQMPFFVIQYLVEMFEMGRTMQGLLRSRTGSSGR